MIRKIIQRFMKPRKTRTIVTTAQYCFLCKNTGRFQCPDCAGKGVIEETLAGETICYQCKLCHGSGKLACILCL